MTLSQHDDPYYATSLLAEEAAAYTYLPKDRVPEGDQLTPREVATGASMLDPPIVKPLVRPVSAGGDFGAE